MRGLRSRHLHFTETREQSIALDRLKGFHIVIAASGMCDAGRIRHRLKNWLWRDEGTVLLTGYQAVGTLGRILQDGARSVRIQGDDIAVRARIRSIDLYSGHADGSELREWIEARLPIRHQVFLVHGEKSAMQGLAARIGDLVGPDHVILPELDQSFVLTATGCQALLETRPARLSPEKVGNPDWHNDLSRLLLEINEALATSPDEATRERMIERLRGALELEKDKG
jgi:metallo-beta-lactamase family protein